MVVTTHDGAVVFTRACWKLKSKLLHLFEDHRITADLPLHHISCRFKTITASSKDMDPEKDVDPTPTVPPPTVPPPTFAPPTVPLLEAPTLRFINPEIEEFKLAWARMKPKDKKAQALGGIKYAKG